MSSRRTKRYWKRVVLFFLCYSIVIPSLYFLLDNKSAIAYWRKDAGELLFITFGLALVISLLITSWRYNDPELKG